MSSMMYFAVAMFQTDFHVCGIAPMDDNVIVFSYSLSNPQEEVCSTVINLHVNIFITFVHDF